jgi:hypothetical protein
MVKMLMKEGKSMKYWNPDTSRWNSSPWINAAAKQATMLPAAQSWLKSEKYSKYFRKKMAAMVTMMK